MTKATVAMLTAAILLPGICHPCKCVPPSPEQDLFDIHDEYIILEGVVEELKYFEFPPEYAPPIVFESNLLVTFHVSQSWSGPVGEWVEFWTHSEESACGYTFLAGHRYIVFVSKTHNTVALCGRTEPAESAHELRTDLNCLIRHEGETDEK